MSSLILWCLLPQHIRYHKAATAEVGLASLGSLVTMAARSRPCHGISWAAATDPLSFYRVLPNPGSSVLSLFPLIPCQSSSWRKAVMLMYKMKIQWSGAKKTWERGRGGRGLSSLICSHPNAPVRSYGPACISPALPPPQNSCLTLCNALLPPQHS